MGDIFKILQHSWRIYIILDVFAINFDFVLKWNNLFLSSGELGTKSAVKGNHRVP